MSSIPVGGGGGVLPPSSLDAGGGTPQRPDGDIPLVSRGGYPHQPDGIPPVKKDRGTHPPPPSGWMAVPPVIKYGVPPPVRKDGGKPSRLGLGYRYPTPPPVWTDRYSQV